MSLLDIKWFLNTVPKPIELLKKNTEALTSQYSRGSWAFSTELNNLFHSNWVVSTSVSKYYIHHLEYHFALPEHDLYLIDKLIFGTTSLLVKDHNTIKITFFLYSKDFTFVSIKSRDSRFSEFLLVMAIILLYFSILYFWFFILI